MGRIDLVVSEGVEVHERSSYPGLLWDLIGIIETLIVKSAVCGRVLHRQRFVPPIRNLLKAASERGAQSGRADVASKWNLGCICKLLYVLSKHSQGDAQTGLELVDGGMIELAVEALRDVVRRRDSVETHAAGGALKMLADYTRYPKVVRLIQMRLEHLGRAVPSDTTPTARSTSAHDQLLATLTQRCEVLDSLHAPVSLCDNISVRPVIEYLSLDQVLIGACSVLENTEPW